MKKFFLFPLATLLIFSASAAWAMPPHETHKAYSDRAFLSEMIVHHQEAVDMAHKAMSEAPDNKVKGWAKTIYDSQEAEISQMKLMLELLGGVDHKAAATMHPMDMSAYKGKGPDSAFVDAMLLHHQNALDMAAEALAQSNNPDVLDLARQIIVDQSAEMRMFKAWQFENRK